MRGAEAKCSKKCLRASKNEHRPTPLALTETPNPEWCSSRVSIRKDFAHIYGLTAITRVTNAKNSINAPSHQLSVGVAIIHAYDLLSNPEAHGMYRFLFVA